MGAGASVLEDINKETLLLTALCEDKQIPQKNWAYLLQFGRPPEEISGEKDLHLSGISGELLYAVSTQQKQRLT
jgi:hypothetical protein